MENPNISELHKIFTVATDKVDIWKRKFNSVVQNERNLDQPEKIKFFINFMAGTLLLYRCKDTQSVLRVLHMYKRQCCLEVYVGNERPLDYILEPLNSSNFCNGNYLDEWNIFLHAMKDGDLLIVKLCVKYGIISEEKSSYERNRIKYRSFTDVDFGYYVGSYLFHRANFWFTSAADKFIPLVSNGNVENNQRNSVHIYIMLEILYTLFQKSKEITEADNILFNNRIQGLNFYYSAMNEPFIPQDEIKDFIKFSFAAEDNREDVVEEMVNNYRGMFHADSTLVYEPRTLKHQTRCAVRKQLCHQDVSLPYLIDQLNVPTVIKELLLGASEFTS